MSVQLRVSAVLPVEWEASWLPEPVFSKCQLSDSEVNW